METTTLLTLASGFIKTFDNEYALADVYILAYLPAGYPDLPGAASPEPLLLASTFSNRDGSFQLDLTTGSPGSPYACYLEHCNAPGIILRCFDTDGSELGETKHAISQLQGITFYLKQTDWIPGPEDWMSVGNMVQETHTLTLDRLAGELTNLAPAGMFKGWPVFMRQGFLYGLENNLLDPEGLLMQAGINVSMAQMQNRETWASIREQVSVLDVPGLMQTFDNAGARAELAGGHLNAAEILLNHKALGEGDVRAGVNYFLGNGGALVHAHHHDLPGIGLFDIFPKLQSPLVGYRDYLVDIWVQRATRQIPQGGLTKDAAVQQLNNRFHQNFRHKDISDQSANKILINILLKILQAPVGVDFGFGIAPAAIAPQDEMTDRQYLDYLISLTGEERHELENRYRLNLSRSDFDLSSPVQQNIETLQRFFTDSFHSPFDPYNILPPLTTNGKPIINELTFRVSTPKPYGQDLYDHRFFSGHGPFFWQYEEWLERNEPFYAENYFDIRRMFWILPPSEEEKKKFWAATNSLLEFLHLKNPQDLQGFLPLPGDEPKRRERIGFQWSRYLLELHDLVHDAHKDFFAGLYPAAEDKYRRLLPIIHDLRNRTTNWGAAGWSGYDRKATAASERTYPTNDPDDLERFEITYHLHTGYDFTPSGYWFNSYKTGFVPYLLDMLLERILPACLAETRLALGKYQEAIFGNAKPYFIDKGELKTSRRERNLAEITGFGVYSGPTPVGKGAKIAPPENLWWTSLPDSGSLPFATDTSTEVLSDQRAKIFADFPPFQETNNTVTFPANSMEKKWFRLKLGETLLEWADVLYRTDKPDNINRARELYKGVLFLHGEDPGIFPAWGAIGLKILPFGAVKLQQNPLLTAQINRAHAGFQQINAGLNYYGIPKDYVPPVRYRVLREAATSLAASAKSTQNDYLNYMAKYEQALLDEMTTRAMVEKASYAVQIAGEQVAIAETGVKEAKKQVETVKAQIEAKWKEMKDSEGFFTQLGDFVSGMKDVADGMAKSGMEYLDTGAAEDGSGDTSLSWMKAYKLLSSKGSASAAGLAGGMAMMAGFGAFAYAGTMSMSSMEAAANKRIGELRHLRDVALPAAERMVEMKQREVKIAGLQKNIAEADYKLGQKMLAFYDYRFLSKAFWQQLSGFTNRLMRRYLDLGGRMAWFAERALSFETDKDQRVISFDYFPKHLRGVTGADRLQLHLAEIEAARIYGLSQTIPVKQTFSMARDFPVSFGQLKKNGVCLFTTSENMFRLAHPGVYGYRLRCVSIGATYAGDAFPHRGMLSNNGISMVSRNDGSTRPLARYPDALPLSEFNMREDMWVYDLPDETLLPFEGSGIETAWELSLSRLGDATSLENLTDLLLTFDMRASYSAVLAGKHHSELPNSLKKSVLISGRAQNPGEVSRFKKDLDVLTMTFRPSVAAGNSVEKNRTVSFLALTVSGVEQSPVTASLRAGEDGLVANFDLTEGIALSNAGFLAGANGGLPLPLNDLTGISADQPFTLTIDAGANAAVDFSKIYDVQLFVEYEAVL